MGWTGVYRYELPCAKTYNQSVKLYLDRQFGHEVGEKYTWDILKSTMVGTTWYGAIQKIDNETGEKEVYAEIIRTQQDGNWVYYKEMSEKAGPYYYNCPVGILNLLTPTDSIYANEWREKCRNKLAETKIRRQILDLAKKGVIRCVKIKMVKADHEVEPMYCYYGKYMYHGKLTACWRNDLYEHINFSNFDLKDMILIYEDNKRGVIRDNKIVFVDNI